MIERHITLQELAGVLGVTRHGAIFIAKKHDIGAKVTGMWMFSEDEVDTAKKHCRAYMLSNRKK